MTYSVVFPDGAYRDLRNRLLKGDQEACAALLTNPVRFDGGTRFLVNGEILLDEDDYSARSNISASLRSETVFRISRTAKQNNQSVLFVHTHPAARGFPEFSGVDAEGEIALSKFLKEYLPSQDALSLIISSDGCACRIMPSGVPVRVVETGRCLTFFSRIEADETEFGRHDRQIRALGKAGEVVFQNLKIGIVGLGGTGSLTVQQLAYLGVRDFTLVDDDTVDLTNLNRVVGATYSDVGRAKTVVASDLIRKVSPNSNVIAINENVLRDATVRKLRHCDFLFCCTDSHGSRAVLNQFAYQFLIPCIDMAISVSAQEGRVSHIVGRIQLLAPGLGCLTCGALLDPGEVRLDLMDEHERRQDPYFLGQAEPQPAVVSLNSTVSSLAVTMFLGAVTQVPVSARFQRYDALSGEVRSVEHLPKPGCIVCSRNGALARGDNWSLPTRKSP